VLGAGDVEQTCFYFLGNNKQINPLLLSERETQSVDNVMKRREEHIKRFIPDFDFVLNFLREKNTQRRKEERSQLVKSFLERRIV